MMGFVAVFGVAVLLATIRLAKGPTAPDRMVAFDTTGTLMVGILVLLAVQFQKPYLIDIAIMYALLTFVATAVLSKYLRLRL